MVFDISPSSRPAAWRIGRLPGSVTYHHLFLTDWETGWPGDQGAETGQTTSARDSFGCWSEDSLPIGSTRRLMRRGRLGMMPAKRGLQDSPCLRRAASFKGAKLYHHPTLSRGRGLWSRTTGRQRPDPTARWFTTYQLLGQARYVRHIDVHTRIRQAGVPVGTSAESMIELPPTHGAGMLEDEFCVGRFLAECLVPASGVACLQPFAIG